MKKIVFLVLTMIFVVSFTCPAQQLSIGFKPSFLIVGAKYSEQPTSTDFSIKARSSYAIGITISDQINHLFGIKIEPRYIVKGYNFLWSSNEKDVIRNNYFSLPLLFSVSPIKNINFELGPEICHLFSSKIKWSGTKSFQSYESPDQKPLEISLLTGITYSLKNRFDFGTRFGIGFTPYEKGQLIVFDEQHPPVYYKVVQRYFEFYLNTRILTKNTKSN